MEKQDQGLEQQESLPKDLPNWTRFILKVRARGKTNKELADAQRRGRVRASEG